MNTAPTVLSPWFVVMRGGDGSAIEYYASEYERGKDEKILWTANPKQAMIFSSLHSAVRIATALTDPEEKLFAWVRVLSNREDYSIFRDQFSEPDASYLNQSSE